MNPKVFSLVSCSNATTRDLLLLLLLLLLEYTVVVVVEAFKVEKKLSKLDLFAIKSQINQIFMCLQFLTIMNKNLEFPQNPYTNKKQMEK